MKKGTEKTRVVYGVHGGGGFDAFVSHIFHLPIPLPAVGCSSVKIHTSKLQNPSISSSGMIHG
jgi:hypothetical protein